VHGAGLRAVARVGLSRRRAHGRGGHPGNARLPLPRRAGLLLRLQLGTDVVCQWRQRSLVQRRRRELGSTSPRHSHHEADGLDTRDISVPWICDRLDGVCVHEAVWVHSRVQEVGVQMCRREPKAGRAGNVSADENYRRRTKEGRVCVHVQRPGRAPPYPACSGQLANRDPRQHPSGAR
jgi:hypothetical protein